MLRLFRWTILFGIAGLFFTAVQEWRDPEVPADYVTRFFHNQTQAWDDNGYVALQGLNAPADTDSYHYGQQKLLAAFARQQELKKKFDVSIPPRYPLPPITPDIPQAEQPLDFRYDEKGGKTSCRYANEQEEASSCINEKTLEAYIARNRTIWERFNRLPDYRNYSVIPVGVEKFFAFPDLIRLAQWKDAEILEQAAAGRPEEAFAQWHRFMILYRRMLSSHDTQVDAAVSLLMTKTHILTYQKLVFHHPDLVSRFPDPIEEALDPNSLYFFKAKRLFTDDWAQMEESMLQIYEDASAEKNEPPFTQPLRDFLYFIGPRVFPKTLMPSGLFRNAVYRCSVSEEKAVMRFWARSVTAQDLENVCASLFPRPFAGDFLKTLTLPGNVVSNVVYFLQFPDIVKGQQLVEAFYHQNNLLSLTFIGSRIIGDKIPPERIPAYLASLSASEYESQAFQWDAAAKRLYLPGSVDEISFYLPAY